MAESKSIGSLVAYNSSTRITDLLKMEEFFPETEARMLASYSIAQPSSIRDSSNLISSSVFGLSANTLESEKQLVKLKNSTTPANSFIPTQVNSLAEVLFDASAYAKIQISQVSMHIDVDFKNSLFRQIDSLLDSEEWDPDDKLMQRDSFKWFLKAILDLAPEKSPSLGISNKGNILSAWVKDKNKLILEFFPSGLSQWSITTRTDEFEEFSSALVSVQLLKEKLAKFNPEFWFKK